VEGARQPDDEDDVDAHDELPLAEVADRAENLGANVMIIIFGDFREKNWRLKNQCYDSLYQSGDGHSTATAMKTAFFKIAEIAKNFEKI
jgi:hypothetical protein